LSVIRRAAWLEGTTVRMRGALTSKRVDLSTAIVIGSSIAHRRYLGKSGDHHRYTDVAVPALVARDPHTGKEIRWGHLDRGTWQQRPRLPAFGPQEEW
jgi:hypothetical protein